MGDGVGEGTHEGREDDISDSVQGSSVIAFAGGNDLRLFLFFCKSIAPICLPNTLIKRMI